MIAVLTIALAVVLVITSVLLIVLILLHRGKGVGSRIFSAAGLVRQSAAQVSPSAIWTG